MASSEVTKHQADVTRLKSEAERLWAAVTHETDSKALRRFLRAYADMHLAAHPITATNPDVTRARNHSRPIPGFATRRYRHALYRTNRALKRESMYLEALLEDPEVRHQGPPRGLCPGCGRRGKVGAKFCDQDGTGLEQVTD